MNPSGDIVTPNPDADNGASAGGADFDGFGGPNISYESFNSPEEQAKINAEKKPEEMTIALTNANGVVSGRPTVDYSWKNIAKALMGVTAIFCIGMVVAVVITVMQINATDAAEKERTSTDRNLKSLYELMGANDQGGAVEALSQEKQIFNGSDMAKVDKILANRFGENYKIDYDDPSINFVRSNGYLKVVSVGIIQTTGTKRVIIYGKIATDEWTLGKFNTNELKPCEGVEGDEAKAIKGIIDCEALQEDIDDAQKEAEKAEKQKAADDKKEDDTKKEEESSSEE